MPITMQQVLERRAETVQDLGFYKGNFYYCSLIDQIPELEGDYLFTNEPDYPCYGMSVMVIGVKSQLREMASLVEKFAQGHPWNLIQWVVDMGQMTEIVQHGHRHREYGVNFDVRYASFTGNSFFEDLAKQYAQELSNG